MAYATDKNGITLYDSWYCGSNSRIIASLEKNVTKKITRKDNCIK
jgi:hypothetical protein